MEKTVDLGAEAAIIRVVNPANSPIYLKNDATVTTTPDQDTYIAPASTTGQIGFGYDNCRYLRLICAETTIVDVEVMSQFKGIHRGILVAGEEKIIEFKGTASSYDIQNLSDTDTIYFSLETRVQVNGAQCIELPPGTGYGDDESVNKLRLISSGPAKYQVKGRR